MASHNSPPRPDTRTRLLDAAVDLIARDGVQAISHRAVEQEAGVARGSTRYHFGTRDDLIEAVIGHLAARDHAIMAQAMAELSPAEADQREALAKLAGELIGDRAGALARFELYLYAARRPALRDQMAAWSRTFTDVGAAYFESQGIAEARDRAIVLSAATDGVVLHTLLTDEPALHRASQWLFEMVASGRTPS